MVLESDGAAIDILTWASHPRLRYYLCSRRSSAWPPETSNGHFIMAPFLKKTTAARCILTEIARQPCQQPAVRTSLRRPLRPGGLVLRVPVAWRPPQKGCPAVRPGWRPSGVVPEARNARPSMPDMSWLGPARLPPSRSPRSIRPPMRSTSC